MKENNIQPTGSAQWGGGGGQMSPGTSLARGVWETKIKN